jgi:hypothetical protein
MEILGYMASALIGVSLGLLGSGGSILTIPVLVYLFHIEPTLATAYSLFIVGITALVGGVKKGLANLVDIRAASLFILPSLISVFLTRRFLIPHIPANLFAIGSFVVTKEHALMLFFACIMVVVAVRMIRSNREGKADPLPDQHTYKSILLASTFIGLVTGLIGAGGGFLIIPALVLLAGLPMEKAVGTSLLIIATNSLIGFMGDICSGQLIDYVFLLCITAIAVGGIFLGSYLATFINGNKLKAAFGWFVLVMSFYILSREVFG